MTVRNAKQAAEQITLMGRLDAAQFLATFRQVDNFIDSVLRRLVHDKHLETAQEVAILVEMMQVAGPYSRGLVSTAPVERFAAVINLTLDHREARLAYLARLVLLEERSEITDLLYPDPSFGERAVKAVLSVSGCMPAETGLEEIRKLISAGKDRLLLAHHMIDVDLTTPRTPLVPLTLRLDEPEMESAMRDALKQCLEALEDPNAARPLQQSLDILEARHRLRQSGPSAPTMAAP